MEAEKGTFFWTSSARVHSDSRQLSPTIAESRRSSHPNHKAFANFFFVARHFRSWIGDCRNVHERKRSKKKVHLSASIQNTWRISNSAGVQLNGRGLRSIIYSELIVTVVV